MMTSLDALSLILPLPTIVMALPLIVIEPSFFMMMLASPVLIVTDSPAVKDRFFSTFNVSSLPTLDWRLPETVWFSSCVIVTEPFLPMLTAWLPPTLIAWSFPALSVWPPAALIVWPAPALIVWLAPTLIV